MAIVVKNSVTCLVSNGNYRIKTIILVPVVVYSKHTRGGVFAVHHNWNVWGEGWIALPWTYSTPPSGE